MIAICNGLKYKVNYSYVCVVICTYVTEYYCFSTHYITIKCVPVWKILKMIDASCDQAVVQAILAAIIILLWKCLWSTTTVDCI